MATVPAKQGRQNHAQHVLAVTKEVLDQEHSPAAMSDQRALPHHTPMVELIQLKQLKLLRINQQKAIIMLFKAFPLFLPPKLYYKL